DLVTVRDVTAVAQRLEMVRRISDEIETYVLELGSDGRLLSLQLNELVGGVDAERTLVVRDYLPAGADDQVDKVLDALAELESSEVLDLGTVASALQIGDSNSLDASVSPHGYRLLARIPRLPPSVVERLITHFGTLQRLLGATLDDLQAVEGVGDLRARGVRDGLSRLAESSILERYV